MITSFILFAFLSLYNILLGFFPDADPIPSLSTTFDWISDQLGTIAAIFPVDTLLLAVAFVLALEATIILVKLLVFVFGFIRGGH